MSIGIILDSIDNTLKNNSSRKASPPSVNNGVHVEEKDPGKSETIAVVDKLNKSVDRFNGKLSFHYHEKTHRVIMKVIDPSTDEVLREIPAKDAIKLLEHIQDFLGVIIDESR